MLWEIVKQDKFLTYSIAVIGIIWIIVFIRNMWTMNKSTWEFQQTYHKILTADEYKVKGRFEQ